MYVQPQTVPRQNIWRVCEPCLLRVRFCEPPIEKLWVVSQKILPRSKRPVACQFRYLVCVDYPNKADAECVAFLLLSFLSIRGRLLWELWCYNAKSKHDQNCAQNDSMFLQGGLSFLGAADKRTASTKDWRTVRLTG